ncbi:TPA: 50S ribosomal protein L31 [Candidatus Uhrbacteria bacterium]|uniref:Large ribosomal subunit protein bL31 n=2 Tax=Candidatus Uhriibacteriota TaxID=1752732 RepID=A0A0G1Q6L2_9BACT|nr:MAG: Ribosomal protein L31 (Modular protein) [Candidatus Uhrbacteria bacterium GW2011_GWF2_46_218]KKU40686.1 MAG: Ribosomal protein L31 (Modular protein) [Candidatus Uhrbacteria bacterium GW2011_GWE2_46_68]HBK34230.1 50S ribosomal protein L31 [Candidatus Uhrbacteria bacterium]HCB18992.1 50S ribosomal protein L31 [Candidatus Uhrbacteria bacterium]
MKKEIHPEYYPQATITCACGQTYVIGSTAKEMSVELCAACHPFYSGKQKIIDTARRVEKYQERALKKETQSTGKKVKRVKRATQKAEKQSKKADVK